MSTCVPTSISTQTLKPRVGVGVLVVRDGKILLGKRKGAHGSGCYAPPGGNLEFRETIEDCAARELIEETGLQATSIKLGPWTQDVMDEVKHYITFFAIASYCEGEPKLLEPTKCEGWDWYEFDALPSPLFAPLSTLLKSTDIEILKRDVSGVC